MATSKRKSKEKLPDLAKIHLVEAFFLESVIRNASERLIAPADVAGFTEPDISLLPAISKKGSQVVFIVKVSCTGLDAAGESMPVSGFFKLQLSFLVENLEDLLTRESDSERLVPTQLLTFTLAGVAYSTVRGMILSKVHDTVLSGFALPLRSVQQLFDESMAEIKAIVTGQATRQLPSAPATDPQPAE